MSRDLGVVGTVLTVVVPTIPGRESVLSRCLFSIIEQAPDSVEILVVDGPGQLGDKANLAAREANGTWMTVVDDDDWLDGAYMGEVLCHLEAGVDFVGFRILEMTNGRWSGSSSLHGDRHQFGRRQHGPTPKGVTRTALWRRTPMGNHYTADRDWCARVAPLISSHAFVDRHLYVYDNRLRSSAFTGAGEHTDVGMWPFDERAIRRIHLA